MSQVRLGRRSPTTSARGGTAAQPGDQRHLAGCCRRVHPAQISGAPAVVFTVHPPAYSSPLTALLPLLCRVLLRCTIAVLAVCTFITTTAIVGVVAVAVGSRIDASFLSIVFGGLGGLLLAPRRRDGDRYGAAAWRSLTRRLRRPMLAAEPRCLRLFSGRSAAFMGVSHMCVYVCTKSAFFRRCGCVCARSVRASAILDPCGHVGMRVVCVRDRQKSPPYPLSEQRNSPVS